MKLKKLIPAILIVSIVSNLYFASQMTSTAIDKYSYSQVASSREYVQIGVVKKNVNLRTEPNSSSSKVITKLTVGTKVEIVDRINKYYKIKYNGGYGYAYYTYFTLEDSITIGIVKKRVNVRSKASSSSTSQVLGKLEAGVEVEIVGKISGYYKIKYNGSYAYVYGTYVEIKEETEEVRKLYVQSDVNLRTAPSTSNSKVITKLTAGTEVEVVGESGTYYKVKYNGGYAYVSKKYVGEKAPEVVEEVTKLYVQSDVNLRTAPSVSNSKVITKLTAGTEVEVVGESGTYYKVKYNGGYAYVSKKYVGEKAPEVVEEVRKLYVQSDVNLRTAPSVSNSQVITVLTAGTEVEVVGESGTYYKVKYNGGYAYVSKKYVGEKAPEPVDPEPVDPDPVDPDPVDPEPVDPDPVDPDPVDPEPVVEPGLKQDELGIYYINEDGTRFTGYKVVDNVPYYFDPNNNGITKSTIVTLKEKDENGNDVTNRYYVLKQGGYLTNEFRTFSTSGNTYYFGEDGKAYRGLKEINGQMYYFHPDTNNAVKGFTSIGDKLYYFNPETARMEKDTVKVLGGKVEVYLGTDGIAYKTIMLDNSQPAKMISAGIAKIGTPYSSDLTQGFDCSGFASYVLDCAEIYVFDSRLSASDQAQYGIDNNLTVGLSELQVGDLIFYNDDSCKDTSCPFNKGDMHIHHVAIYLGDGKVMESSGSNYAENSGVRVADVNFNKEGRTYYPYMAIRVTTDNGDDGEWTPGWQ